METKTATHTYEVIGEPRIEPEYSDKWQTAMVFELRRDDGKQDTIWICAGVPGYQRGSSVSAGHRYGFEDVEVFGGSLGEWCGPDLYADLTDQDGDIDTGRIADEKYAMLQAVREAALASQVEIEESDDDGESCLG